MTAARQLLERRYVERERITALFRNLEVNDRAAAVDTAWRLGILPSRSCSKRRPRRDGADPQLGARTSSPTNERKSVG
ncbi:hypothetical protein [Amycolatopsis thermoflava]|uniref:hypothetical protein n=1 Tax=Amycolatopsis thermoflava TaxID=84480 RepID=UPI0004032D61|nr:hypothetical protein [Amycolatopsis thermoflava]